jgi:putative transcriptional regulator
MASLARTLGPMLGTTSDVLRRLDSVATALPDWEIVMATKPMAPMNYEDKLFAGLRDVLNHVKGEAPLQAELFVPEQDVKKIRDELGLSQSEFSARFAIPLASLKNWEQGRRSPDQPTNVLLYLISQMPTQVRACISRCAASDA